MFHSWLNTHAFGDYTFGRLYPKAAQRDFWGTRLGQAQVDDAQALLGYEWPLIRATQFMEYHLSGSRRAQEDPHFDRRCAMMDLFFGELAEGKGRFLPDIVDGIFMICEETYWGLSAHNLASRKKDLLPRGDDPYVDLFAAETAELLALIYHILYDELRGYCPMILDRLEYELDRRILTPHLLHTDFNWMGYDGRRVNNWLPWIDSNILTVLLLCPQPKDKREQILRKLFTEMQQYYDTIPADGGCDEGSAYWTKAGAKVFEFCDVLYRTTNGALDLFNDEKLRQMALYETRTYIDGCRFVNFADSTGIMDKNAIEYLLYGFGLRLQEPSLCRLAGSLRRARGCKPDPRVFPRGISAKASLGALVYAREMDALPPFEPEKQCILPDLQNAFLRRGAWYLAAKGGHNQEHHNHNDVGSFLLCYDNAPLLLDPGCGTYTRQTFSADRYSIWTMQSAWHNLPVVNGVQQKDGREFAADSFRLEEDTVAVSYANAYPAASGLKTAVRKLTLWEDGLALEDSFSFRSEENTIEEHFLTLYQPESAPGGIRLGNFLLETQLPWQAEYRSFEGDAKLVDAWQAQGLWRIRLQLTCGRDGTTKFKVRSIL